MTPRSNAGQSAVDYGPLPDENAARRATTALASPATRSVWRTTPARAVAGTAPAAPAAPYKNCWREDLGVASWDAADAALAAGEALVAELGEEEEVEEEPSTPPGQRLRGSKEEEEEAGPRRQRRVRRPPTRLEVPACTPGKPRKNGVGKRTAPGPVTPSEGAPALRRSGRVPAKSEKAAAAPPPKRRRTAKTTQADGPPREEEGEGKRECGDAAGRRVAGRVAAEGEWYVEEILRVGTDSDTGKRAVYIKWWGWGEEDNSWEPEDHLTAAPGSYKLAPGLEYLRDEYIRSKIIFFLVLPFNARTHSFKRRRSHRRRAPENESCGPKTGPGPRPRPPQAPPSGPTAQQWPPNCVHIESDPRSAAQSPRRR